MLSIRGDFDGGNPRNDGIHRLGDSDFRIDAFTETDHEAFRLEVIVGNDSDQPAPVHLDIRWPNEAWSHLRDGLYFKPVERGDWTFCPAVAGPGTTSIDLMAPPGEGYLCLHPHYGYDDSEAFIAGLNHPLLEKTIDGQSENQRNIWRFRVADPLVDDSRPRIVVAARNHANESSGNYCVEGMLQWLLSDDQLARHALTRFQFYFLPMTNPDGVDEGMNRYTRPGGANLNRDSEATLAEIPGCLPDASHESFYRALDDIRPDLFMNLHSYLFKHKDELYGPSDEAIEKFIRFMPDQIEFGKVWRRKITGQQGMTGGYCARQYGATSFLAEVPWFGRNSGAMRQHGVRILRALILMNTLVEDQDWGTLTGRRD